MVWGKAEDEGALTPVKDDNAVPRHLGPQTFAKYFDDCYKRVNRTARGYRPVYLFSPTA